MAKLDKQLVDDLTKLSKAGDELAVAAARVCAEYDGVHRLRAALAKWFDVRAGIYGDSAQPQSTKQERYMMSEVETYMDGDRWCAVYKPTFINIQESPAGFGDTENEALLDLIKSQAKHIQSDLRLEDMPFGTYIAKGKRYRAWMEDEDGNFPDGLDAYDGNTPQEALSRLIHAANQLNKKVGRRWIDSNSFLR